VASSRESAEGKEKIGWMGETTQKMMRLRVVRNYIYEKTLYTVISE
jgi:hypothetical protein